MDARAYVESHREEMLDLWAKMVNTECGSTNKAGVDEIPGIIRPLLDEMGFTVTIHEEPVSGNALVATRGDMTKPFILVIGHMDTVFAKGEAAARPFTIKEDGRAYGPGVLDMKGGIVIGLHALRALYLAEELDFPVKIVLAGDEEVLHIHSGLAELMKKEAAGAICCFNMETGFLDHSIVTQRKGSYQFKVETFGRGCHIGNDPENGRSAIVEISHKIIEIEKLTNMEEGYNVNVGVMEGGTVPNAAPAHASIVCDLRYIKPEQLAYFKEKLAEVLAKQYVPDVTTKLTDMTGMPPMNVVAGTDELFALAVEASREEGFPLPKPKLCGGGSDSAYTTAAGIPTLCAMGVLGARNHTVEEFAEVESLFERTILMVNLLKKAAKL